MLSGPAVTFICHLLTNTLTITYLQLISAEWLTEALILLFKNKLTTIN